MDANVQVLEMEIRHVPQILTIAELNYPGKYESKEVEAVFTGVRQMVKNKFFVVEHNKFVVSFGGWCVAQSWPDKYGLYWLNTISTFQGKGYASLIVEKIIESVKQEATGRRVVLMLSCREQLVKYYQKFGFVQQQSNKDLMILVINN